MERDSLFKFLEGINHKIPLIFEFTNGVIFKAKFDTSFETDNGLDDDDKAYMEYYACAFEILEILQGKNLLNQEEGDLIEISILNPPSKVYLENGKTIWENKLEPFFINDIWGMNFEGSGIKKIIYNQQKKELKLRIGLCTWKQFLYKETDPEIQMGYLIFHNVSNLNISQEDKSFIGIPIKGIQTYDTKDKARNLIKVILGRDNNIKVINVEANEVKWLKEK